MEWSTHALSGAVAGYIVTGGDYRGAILGGIGGVIPDLDEPKSKFGKIFSPISLPLNRYFGHRTLTHSLLFSVLSGFLLFIFTNWWIALSVTSGIIAHILGDMLTGKVKFLYPCKRSVGIRIHPSLFVPIDRVARYLLLVLFVLLIIKDITV